MTRRWPVAGLVFAVLWVFVRGPAFEPAALFGQLLFGLAVGVPVAFVFRRLYEEDIYLRRSVRTLPYAVLYVLVFLREIVVANLDVAYRVLAPSARIEPEVFLVPLRVETDLGVTTIANSITITPGTLTLDHDPDENALYVHVIDGRDPDAIVEPIRTWEDYALRIFDEPRSPDDPAPPIRDTPEDEPPDPKRAPVGAEIPMNRRSGTEAGERRSGAKPDEGGESDGR